MAIADLLGGASPYGAALGGIAGTLAGSPSSNAKGAPVSATGPVINIAGFGSKASGSASSNARDDSAPADLFSSTGSGGLPGWVLPAGVLLIVAVVAVAILKK